MSVVARSPYPSSSSFDTPPVGPSSSMDHAQQHQAAYLARQHPNHPQPGQQPYPGQQQQMQQQQQMAHLQQGQPPQPRPMVRRNVSSQMGAGGPGGGGIPVYGQPNGQMIPQQRQQQYSQHTQFSPHQPQQQQQPQQMDPRQREREAYMRQQSAQPIIPAGVHPSQAHQLPLHPSTQPQQSTPYQNHPQAFNPQPGPPTPSQQHLAHLSQASHRPQSTPPPPSALSSQGAYPSGSTPSQAAPQPSMHPHQRQPSLSPPNQLGPPVVGGPQHPLQHHQQVGPQPGFKQGALGGGGGGGGGVVPGPGQLQLQQQQMYARQRAAQAQGGYPNGGGPPPQQRIVQGNQMMMQPRGVQGLGMSGSKAEPAHGAAILRLLQYFAGFSDGERRSELGYWRDLVETYFSEHGYLSLDLKSTTQGDTKHFDIPTSVLPRYFLVGYETGLKSIALNLENPRESRTAVSNLGVRSITVDVTRASMTHTFANGCQVVTMGTLKCSLVVTNEGGEVSPLLIDRIHYEAHSHTEYVARAAMVPQLISQQQKDLLSAVGGDGGSRNQTPMAQAPTPSMTPKMSGDTATTTSKKAGGAAKGGKGKGKEVESKTAGGVDDSAGDEDGAATDASSLMGVSTTSTQPEVFSLPASSVNDFGISPGMMRCLELAQGMATMGPLFTFCQTNNLSPKEGLRRYADNIRASQLGNSNLHQSLSASTSQSSNSPPQPPTPLNAQPPNQQQQQPNPAQSTLNSLPPPINNPTPTAGAGQQVVTPSPLKEAEPTSTTTTTTTAAGAAGGGSLKRKKQSSNDDGEGEGDEDEEKPTKNGRPVRNRAGSRRSSRGGPGSGTG